MKHEDRDLALFTFCVIISILAWAKFLLPLGGVYIADYASRLAIVLLVLSVVGVGVLKPGIRERMTGAVAVLCVIALTLAVDYVAVRTLSSTPLVSGFQFPSIPEPALRWTDAIVGIALVAVHEELVFRHLPARLSRSRNWTTQRTYILSAVMFSIIHAPQGYSFILLSAVFAVLAMYLYLRFDSLWPPIAAHFAINFILFSPIACWINLRACG